MSRRESNAVTERAAVRALAALQRTRNTNKLCFDRNARGPHHRIAVPTHVDELHVRRQVPIRQRSRLRDVSAARILQTRTNSVPKQHVHRRLRASLARPLSKEQRSERMAFGEAMFKRFYHTWRPYRAGHKCNS